MSDFDAPKKPYISGGPQPGWYVRDINREIIAGPFGDYLVCCVALDVAKQVIEPVIASKTTDQN